MGSHRGIRGRTSAQGEQCCRYRADVHPLHRDALNATVGRSMLRGVLLGPAIAAAAFIPALIPLMMKAAHASLGSGSENILFLGGPLTTLIASAYDAILFPVVAFLFVLAW